jgi:hypothetical protein
MTQVVLGETSYAGLLRSPRAWSRLAAALARPARRRVRPASAPGVGPA